MACYNYIVVLTLTDNTDLAVTVKVAFSKASSELPGHCL